MPSKPELILIITALTTAVLISTAILPNIHHPYFVYRISIHIASIIISVFLIVVSILSYRRTGSIKILYISVAFLSLLVVELIFLLQIIDGSSRIMIPAGLYGTTAYTSIEYASPFWIRGVEGRKIM